MYMITALYKVLQFNDCTLNALNIFSVDCLSLLLISVKGSDNLVLPNHTTV